MVSVLVETVKKVSIFMIIGRTVLHLGIGAKYEKYAKIVVSFMVLVQIFFSVSTCFNKLNIFEHGWNKGEYEKKLEMNLEKFENDFEEKQKILSSDLKSLTGNHNMDVQESKIEKIEIDKIVICE